MAVLPNGDVTIPKEAWHRMLAMLSLVGERLMSLTFPSVSLSINGNDIPDDVREDLMKTGLQAGITAALGMMPVGGTKLDAWEYDMFLGSALKAYVLGLRQGGPDRARQNLNDDRDTTVKEVLAHGEDKAHELASQRALQPNSGFPAIDNVLSALQQTHEAIQKAKGTKGEITDIKVIPINSSAIDAEKLEKYLREQLGGGRLVNISDLRTAGVIPPDAEVVAPATPEVAEAAAAGDRKADDVRDLMNSPEYLRMLEDES